MLLPSIPGRNVPASVSASTHVESPSPALGDQAWASICSLSPPLCIYSRYSVRGLGVLKLPFTIRRNWNPSCSIHTAQ